MTNRRRSGSHRLCYKGSTLFLGRYDTIEEAIEDRKAAEDKYFGKYMNKE